MTRCGCCVSTAGLPNPQISPDARCAGNYSETERIMAADPTPTPQAPGAPEPTNPPVPAPAPVPSPSPAAQTPPWGKDEDFNPEKAWELIQNLRKEKTPDTKALEAKVTELQNGMVSRNQALAEALGLKEAPKTEDLAETVKNLQSQFQASQAEATKLRIAAEKGVPAEYHYLLTETDTEKLTAQAEMAAEYARLKAAAAGTPEFQANPGQGQGGGTPTPEALAEAEYAKFYPTPK